jgi:hypothetical protein
VDPEVPSDVVSSTRNDLLSIARLTMGPFSGVLFEAKGK